MAQAGFLLSLAPALLGTRDRASNRPPWAGGFCAPILKKQTQQTTQELASLLAGLTQTQSSDS